MYTELISENLIVLNPAALIVYLLLAGIAGWTIRAVLRKRWWHRFWEHDTGSYQYPHRRHTYIEYVPEISPQLSTQEMIRNLMIVEGIDHNVESILNRAGIITIEDLANTPASEIREILQYAGIRHGDYDPTTWPHQAHLALNRKWDELKRYQDFLKLY